MNLSAKHVKAILALTTVLAVALCAKLAPVATAAQVKKPVATGPLNQLTEEEKKAGWKLLFDGKTLDGWHNFKKDTVKAGWQVKDGELVCVNPKNAGDILTKDDFAWFDLILDFKLSEAGNSGIIFHVTNAGKTTWASGPEVQLLDNLKGADAQRCGWLYQLYKPENDPKTNKPLDATKPAGEWNQIRVVIAAPPEKSSVTMNGTKYYDFVFHSEDWKDRVAKSKFKKEAEFAKSGKGAIALQGDHGTVSFRNIKIRSLPGKGTPSKVDN